MPNNNLQKLRRKLEALARLVANDVPVVLKTEGLKFIQKNFQDEGFNDEGLQKWLSRPKNGLQLFCQFNLCFSFFKLSIVYKNSFTTSV